MAGKGKDFTVRGFRCGGLDKSCPEFICASHAEVQRTDKTVGSSSIAIGGNLDDTGTPDILSERSESPKSTDSDDDHIVEAAIRYFKATFTPRRLSCPTNEPFSRKRLLRRSAAEGEKSGESRRSSAASSPILSSRSASPASLISSSSDDEPPPAPVGSSAAAVKSDSDDDEIVVVREIPFNERAEAPSLGSRGQQLPAPGDVSQVAKSPIREDPSSKAAVIITSSATEEVCGLRTCSPEHKKQRIIDGEEVKINLVDLISSESEVDSENEANLITLD